MSTELRNISQCLEKSPTGAISLLKALKSVFTIKTRVTCDYVGSDTCTVTSLAQGAEVSQVALSCDGLTLASGDTGGGVTLWDTASGRQ